MKKIKILHILSSLEITNGIASFIMSYYKYIDHSKFDFDFLVTSDINDYEHELSKYDSKVFVTSKPSLKNTFKFIRDLKDFFKNHNEYDIIHCHVPNAGAFVLPIASKYSSNIRILHSHVTKSADILSHKIRNDMLQFRAKKYATNFLACTDDAGKYLYGNKTEYKVIRNAIDLNKFSFNKDVRNKIRKELGIEDKLVIGNVGRYVNQKNPLFTIDIFKEFNKNNPESILIMIGDGSLLNNMKEKVKNEKLDDKVMFISPKTNVQDYYMAMDLFVLPSIYEGLGIVYVEAQASGIPTFASDVVPADTKVSDLMHYISLSKPSTVWANEIAKFSNNLSRIDTKKEITKCGYNIENEVKELEKYYESLL